MFPVGGGRRWGKDVGGGIWCKYCVYMYVNGKMKSVETIPGIEGGNKGEWLRAWTQIYLIYCKSFCECNNVPLPSPIIKKEKKKKIIRNTLEQSSSPKYY
jgi:hypothetical protein